MGLQIWPCRKKIKGQPTIIIWINLVDVESMYMDIAAILINGTWLTEQIFNPP